MPASSQLRAFLTSLPKTETHLHVEGALPYDLLHAWKPETYPLNPDFRAPHYRYKTFPDFERILLDNALPWFNTAERYYEATRVMFERHAALNVTYVETSFHLPVTQFLGIPGKEIIAAIRSAVPKGLTVKIFTGMPRDAYQGALKTVIDDLENWDDLAGIDLHGFEGMPTLPWTAGVWKRLQAAGKITKCHAGEFGGAERVREAIELLGVKRIQHGVRAIEDPAVVALARDQGVTFDMCPISNVRLNVVESIKTHPLRSFMKAGIRCTVSTDDPLCFANTLLDEYLALYEEGGFSVEELVKLIESGWEVAQVEEKVKASTLATLRSKLKQYQAT